MADVTPVLGYPIVSVPFSQPSADPGLVVQGMEYVTAPGPWLARPSPVGRRGKLYFATDIGPSGTLLVSNNYAWVPLGGRCLLGAIGPLEFPNQLAEYQHPDSIVIPGGFLGGMGAIHVDAWVERTGVLTNSTTLKAVFTDAYAANENWIASIVTSAATSKAYRLEASCVNQGHETQNWAATVNSTVFGDGAISTTSVSTIDTSYDSKIVFRGTKSVATDGLLIQRAYVWAIVP